MQPLLVSTSALELATETVALILRIDDIQVGHAVHKFPDRSRLMATVHAMSMVNRSSMHMMADRPRQCRNDIAGKLLF